MCPAGRPAIAPLLPVSPSPTIDSERQDRPGDVNEVEPEENMEGLTGRRARRRVAEQQEADHGEEVRDDQREEQQQEAQAPAGEHPREKDDCVEEEVVR